MAIDELWISIFNFENRRRDSKSLSYFTSQSIKVPHSEQETTERVSSWVTRDIDLNSAIDSRKWVGSETMNFGFFFDSDWIKS